MTVRGSTLRQNPAYRPGGSHPTVRLATLLLVAVAACRAPVPRQSLPPAESPAPISAPVAPARWIFARDLLAKEYLVEQAAEIFVTADSGTATDSSTLVIAAAVRPTADGGVAGLIRSAVLRASGAPEMSISGLVLPMAFTGAASTPGIQHSLSGRAVSADPCQTPAHSVLNSIRDIVVSVPDTLTIGQTWGDSGRADACRGGARLLMYTTRRFAVRSYEVREGRSVLRVDRRTTLRLSGTASRSGDTTVVEGLGSGTGEVVLDATTGALVEATASSTLEISVRGAVRSERARQLLRTRVRQPNR